VPTRGGLDETEPEAVPAGSGAFAVVRSLALPDLLDGLRARRQLLVRAVTPLLLFAVVFGITVARSGVDGLDPRPTWVIAVEGDLDGARRTLLAIGGGQVELVATDDASIAVIDGAVAGVRVPDALDDRIERGEVVTIDVIEVTPNADSRAAVSQMGAGALNLDRAALLDAVGSDGGVLFTIDRTDVQLTRGGVRSLGAELVAAVVCLQASMLVSGAANRFAGRRAGGLLAAQLLLPVDRRQLALGKGVAELSVGIVASLPILVPLALLAEFVAITRGSAALAVIAIPAVLATAFALDAFTTAIGLFVGVLSRGPEQVTLATGGAVVVSAMVATFVALGDVGRPSFIAVVPFVGAVNALRETLSGAASPLWLLVGVASTVGAALLLVRRAGRSFDAERFVGRAA